MKLKVIKVLVRKLCPLCHMKLISSIVLDNEDIDIRRICHNHDPKLAFKLDKEVDISLFLQKIKRGEIFIKKMTPHYKNILENKFQKSIINYL